MIDGLDVSAHQSTTPSLAGQSFLFARATYGATPDGRYRQHVAAARRAGLVTGAYLFLLPERLLSIAAQANAFLEAIGDVELVAVDQEAEASHEAPSNGETRAAIAIIRAARGRCGLYHSTSGYPRDANGADWRWVADYRPLDQPPIAWDVWQWTSFAGGVHLDRNRFRGSAAELRQLGGIMGPLTFTLPASPVGAAGILTIDAGTRAIAVATGEAYTVPEPVARVAYRVQLAGGLSSRGFLVDLHSDVAHFIRDESVPDTAFVPAAAPATVDRTAVLNEAIDAIAALKLGGG